MAKISLAAQLATAKTTESYLRDRIRDNEQTARHDKEKIAQLETEIRGAINAERDCIAKLFEIVRWHTNPDTARYPFQSDKSQRDSGFRNTGY